MLATSLLLKKKTIAATTTTFSPTLKATSVSVSNGNLRANCGNTGGSVFATLSRAVANGGKWYFEVLMTQFEGSVSYSPLIGLGTTTTPFNMPWTTNSGEVFWYCTGAVSQLIYNSDVRANYGVTGFTQGDYIGMAVDFVNKQFTYYRNGVNEGTLSLTTYSPGQTNYYPVISSPNGQVGATIVDWQASPKYTPSGYSLW